MDYSQWTSVKTLGAEVNIQNSKEKNYEING